VTRWLLLAALLLAGCAGPLGSAGNADQLKELVKVKDANITCIIANTPYGKGSALFLNLDKAVIQAGSISVSDSCNTTIMLEPKNPVPTPK